MQMLKEPGRFMEFQGITLVFRGMKMVQDVKIAWKIPGSQYTLIRSKLCKALCLLITVPECKPL